MAFKKGRERLQNEGQHPGQEEQQNDAAKMNDDRPDQAARVQDGDDGDDIHEDLEHGVAFEDIAVHRSAFRLSLVS